MQCNAHNAWWCHRCRLRLVHALHPSCHCAVGSLWRHFVDVHSRSSCGVGADEEARIGYYQHAALSNALSCHFLDACKAGDKILIDCEVVHATPRACRCLRYGGIRVSCGNIQVKLTCPRFDQGGSAESDRWAGMLHMHASDDQYRVTDGRWWQAGKAMNSGGVRYDAQPDQVWRCGLSLRSSLSSRRF